MNLPGSCDMQGLEKENRRKPKNPLYQTIVLDKPTVLRKCHLITEKQSRFVMYIIINIIINSFTDT